MIRILTVDDHPVFRDGLRFALESIEEMEVVGETGMGEDVEELCGSLAPDVVLLDINLPDINGVTVAEMIIEKFPAIKILVLTMETDVEVAIRALKAGCQGYLVKGIQADELPDSIRKVSRGETVISSSISEKIAFRTFHSGKDNPLNMLSARELEVVKEVVQGKVIRVIAGEMGLSPGTVETYKRRAMKKLGIDSLHALIQFALKHNLLK